MASPLLVFSSPALSASPTSVTLPGARVTFSSTLFDLSASVLKPSDRVLTLMLDGGNDLTFENGAKSISETRAIAFGATNVDLTHTINGTGAGLLGISVSQFDDTGKLLGQIVLGKNG